MARAVVVGAGLAGAAAGRALADQGFSVVVLDKGRGPGGRLATRRSPDDPTVTFDHGAPWFSLRDDRARAWVAPWQAEGVLQRWEGPFGALGADGFRAEDLGERWVGAPSSSAVVRRALRGLDARFGARVTGLARRPGGWVAVGVEDAGAFDLAVVAVPAPQAVPLLSEAPALAAALAAVEVAPCWAAMVEPGEEPPAPFAAARVLDSAAGWVAREHTRPGRGGPPRWVIHGTAAWSAAHLEDPPEAVGAALLAAIRERVALPAASPVVAHRWRYARVTRPVGVPALVEPSLGLGVCGDALLGGRVEDAIRSGLALADAIAGRGDVRGGAGA
jgi:renalase